MIIRFSISWSFFFFNFCLTIRRKYLVFDTHFLFDDEIFSPNYTSSESDWWYWILVCFVSQIFESWIDRPLRSFISQLSLNFCRLRLSVNREVQGPWIEKSQKQMAVELKRCISELMFVKPKCDITFTTQGQKCTF